MVKAIQSLPPGGHSTPIRTLGGYYIIKLHNQRRFLVPDPNAARLRLRQVSITIADGGGAAARKVADDLRASIKGCAAIAGAVQGREGITEDDLGTLAIGQLSAAIRQAVNDLPDGQLSATIDLGDLLMLLMVCERERQVTELPGREAVLAELGRRQLHKLSQRFIRDLRRDALVEYR